MSPNYLIIGGTFKSGTSSLFTYLGQVKGIEASKEKETGYFVPAKYGENADDISAYLKFFPNDKNTPAYRIEGSPGYLNGGKNVANAITDLLGKDVKMIFLLRKPTDRLMSLYNMLLKNNEVYIPTVVADRNLSFGDYIQACKTYTGNQSYADEAMDFAFNGLSDGYYAMHLKEWYAVMPAENIRVVFFDHLTTKPEEVCKDILNWVGIDEDAIDGVTFRPVNQTLEYKNSFVKRTAFRINKRLQGFLRRNERLKHRLIQLYVRLNTKKTVKGEYEVERAQLENHYKKHNQELKELLIQKGYSNFPGWLN